MTITALVLSVISLLTAFTAIMIAAGNSVNNDKVNRNLEHISEFGSHHFSEMDKRLSILEQKAKIRIIRE